MRSPFAHKLLALPGPLWLFGAYGACRLGTWFRALLAQGLDGTLSGFSSGSVPMLAAGLAAAAVPWLLIGMLALRKPGALWLMRWYAGLRAAVCTVALFLPFFAQAESGSAADAIDTAIVQGVRCLLWLGFLRYLEKSRTLAHDLPAEQTRVSWQAWIGLTLLILFALFGW